MNIDNTRDVQGTFSDIHFSLYLYGDCAIELGIRVLALQVHAYHRTRDPHHQFHGFKSTINTNFGSYTKQWCRLWKSKLQVIFLNSNHDIYQYHHERVRRTSYIEPKNSLELFNFVAPQLPVIDEIYTKWMCDRDSSSETLIQEMIDIES